MTISSHLFVRGQLDRSGDLMIFLALSDAHFVARLTPAAPGWSPFPTTHLGSAAALSRFICVTGIQWDVYCRTPPGIRRGSHRDWAARVAIARLGRSAGRGLEPDRHFPAMRLDCHIHQPQWPASRPSYLPQGWLSSFLLPGWNAR